MSDTKQDPRIVSEFHRHLRLNRLRRDASHDFDITPDERERTAIKASLDLLGLRKMRFRGALSPLGRDGWSLRGMLGATVDQPCVATLEPVRSRIDIEVKRTYISDAEELALSEEVEITADTPDEVEQLVPEIDLGALAMGELALALPPYPRSADAPSTEDELAGKDPAETHQPFAGLAALREKMQAEDPET